MKRRLALVLGMVGLMVVVAAGVALAANITCTANNPCTGTGGSDVITGSLGDDNIAASAGDDIVNARSGDDRAFGDGGDDTIHGGAGRDHLEGGGGIPASGPTTDTLFGDSNNDFVMVVDGDGRDFAGGGDGDEDVCVVDIETADQNDDWSATTCENVAGTFFF